MHRGSQTDLENEKWIGTKIPSTKCKPKQKTELKRTSIIEGRPRNMSKRKVAFGKEFDILTCSVFGGDVVFMEIYRPSNDDLR